MKKRNLLAMMLMGFALFLGSCSDDDTPDPTPVGPDVELTEAQMNAVINTYVDKVVLPTYADMELKVTAMSTAVNKFITSGTQEDLEAACLSWRAAREPWELSEAFLYGPASDEGLDPSLDSWPLQKDDIDQILRDGDFSGIEGETVEAQGVRGFHTLEYLLFEDGKAKTATNITTNEKGYMQRVTARLLKDTQDLHGAWVDGYADRLKAHNDGFISSAEYVLGSLISDGGIRNIATEVGGSKIGNPYDYWKSGDKEEAVLQVESWYSWNSLDDYVNNIISIENSYMGGRRGDRNAASSFSELVKLVDEDLDTRVKAQIAATIAAIEDIPAPFRNNLGASEEIEKAMDACSDLYDIFKEVESKLKLN